MPRPAPSPADLPPLLREVILAAAHAARFDLRASRRGESDALVDLGRLARRIVPGRGVLAPVDDDICREIHRVTQAHLGYGRASRNFRAGLRRLVSFEDRNAIEVAHADLVNATSIAYYYAGLATGIVFADRSR